MNIKEYCNRKNCGYKIKKISRQKTIKSISTILNNRIYICLNNKPQNNNY